MQQKWGSPNLTRFKKKKEKKKQKKEHLTHQMIPVQNSPSLPQALKSFLDLQYNLPPIKPPVCTSQDKFPDAEKRERFFDMCEEKHKDVHAELLKNGKDAA
eukprot:11316709-Ditylum_brightwellii.AAC.1